MKFIDLFAGLGGFHVALRRLGHECVFASEIDEGLQNLYFKNFGIKPQGDIRKVAFKDIPKHDILCAGSPCQPFSKAGEQAGFNCPKWGDLLEYVIKVLKHHKPQYFILENVPNLGRHDGGETFKSLRRRLRTAGYDTDSRYLSPHQFGIPQIRERMFIVGSTTGLKDFVWPLPEIGKKPALVSVLDTKPQNAKMVAAHHLKCLRIWQRFLKASPKKIELPSFPIWSMEFGATYPYLDKTPHASTTQKLHKLRGSHGKMLKKLTRVDIMAALPSYARTKAKTFPKWKIDFIRQNRDFYRRNKSWIKPWLSSVLEFHPSLQKLEWNCKGEKRDIWKYVIQFRASGVRIKRPSSAPSLIAFTTTHVPVIAWEKRYMSATECARLQCLDELQFLPAASTRAYKALGNAVNAEVVQKIISALVPPTELRLNESNIIADQSTTYTNLLSLRNSLPHHSFLQYTATPQAPLLINLIDALSPEFAEALTPGTNYFGGEDFFVLHPELVRTIPPHDIPTNDNELDGPPDSLVEALRIFVIGVAAGIVVNQSRGNRSMMVHPSQATAPHAQFHHWVVQVTENWRSILEQEPDSADRNELLAEFSPSYQDLAATVPGLPSFEVLSQRLLHALRRTVIHQVNAVGGKTPHIPWRDTYGHILVGGQAMDRGFTVEGLTVTYMPRGVGVGNADTVQQRARFFGYKRPYYGYCRVYLEGTVRTAYQMYVEHEEDIRERLIQHSQTGRPLAEWKRAFFLNTALRPTRNSVLQLPYMQDSISDDWYVPKAPHETPDAAEENRGIVSAFVAGLAWADDTGHTSRTATQRHKVTTLPLGALYADLLTQIRVVNPRDSQKFTGMLLQVGRYVENHSDEAATVYNMSAGNTRERELNAADEIPQLFQGKNPRVGDVIYPGDRAIRSAAGLTVQIHTLRILRPSESGPIEFANNVFAIAVWVPEQMSHEWLVQRQQ
jgi:DNA (cytosine-5)-methyltransferase 1